MKKKGPLSVLIVVILLAGYFIGWRWYLPRRDVKKFCGVMTDVMENPKDYGDDPNLKAEKIARKLQAAILSPRVVKLFNAISMMDPADRVQFISEDFRAIMGDDYTCPAIKSFFGQNG